MKSDLIRPEALNSLNAPSVGNVVLIHPMSHHLLAGVAVLLFISIVIVAFFGEYTRHSLIAGIIEPTAGLDKIYAPQPGLIDEVIVKEGETVKRGQVLVRALAEHRNGLGADVGEAIGNRTRARLIALQEELAGTMKLNDQEVESSRESLTTLLHSRTNLITQSRVQTSRANTAAETLVKFEGLRKAGFVSAFQLVQHEAEQLDQQSRLEALRKDIIACEGEIIKVERDLQTLPLKRKVSRTQLEQSIATVEGEIAQNSAEHGWTVVAPSDGTVTDVAIVAGQTATPGTPLVSVMPKESKLRAKIYAPSKALGFIHPGSEVKIRLDAFPFQKFGLAKGYISRIADSPTPANEFTSNTNMMPRSNQNQDPLFAIVVELQNEYVTAYGKQEHLRAGMQINGDVQLDRRKLYEWILEPLFTVTGR